MSPVRSVTYVSVRSKFANTPHQIGALALNSAAVDLIFAYPAPLLNDRAKSHGPIVR